jgi:hypothetical protein
MGRYNCALSQKRRKKVEEPFGWTKTQGGMAQTVLCGVERVHARFTLTRVACDLANPPRLLAVSRYSSGEGRLTLCGEVD